MSIGHLDAAEDAIAGFAPSLFKDPYGKCMLHCAGSKAMGPGRHAGLLTVAAVGAAGKKLSVKGRLMKKLRLG